MSTWSDEAHQFGRGFESAQIQILRKSVFVRSHFNVIITGTLFPLGSETDANGVLQTIGGRYDNTGKWSRELARSFLRLVGGGKHDPKIFQTLALHIFMAPFTLRRTSSSTWFGEWVIQRVWSRPEPEIILPFPDDETSDLAKQFVRVPRNKDKTDLSLNEIMERADMQKFIAWAPLYRGIVGCIEAEKKMGKTTVNRIAIMEQVVATMLNKTSFSGRLRCFVSFVKALCAKGQRFIVVADRLFPLILTYYV